MLTIPTPASTLTIKLDSDLKALWIAPGVSLDYQVMLEGIQILRNMAILTSVVDNLVKLVSGLTTTVSNLNTTVSNLETKMSQQMDTLAAQVASNTTVIESAITLINGFSTQLAAGIAAAQAGDLSKLQDMATQLATEDQKLAAAVAANTAASTETTTTTPPAGP